MDWYHNLWIVLSVEDKLPFLEQPIPVMPVPPTGQVLPSDVLNTHTAWVKALEEIAGHWRRNCFVYLTELMKKNKLSQGAITSASVSLEDLEIIQEEDTHPSIDTSLHHDKDDQEIDEPQSDINPIRKSSRTRRALNQMCLHVDAEEHELGDLSESANYKAALLDPKSDKWLNAMNVEMQSMRDNKVWDLVDHPPNGKTIGYKWLFKKKIDMYGLVHTYKAHLVAKGFTQTSGIYYEETFSLVVDIRAIRILIAIAAFYDYKIWQMDVKIAFLNRYLNEEVYMEQPKDRSKQLIGLCQSAYIEKILKRYFMENSKRRTIPMQEKVKLSKSQGASTPVEKQRMQNIPYALAGGSIMVSCYTDVGYLMDIDDLKSQTGYVFILNGGAVDWKSMKQSVFPNSSKNAKYIDAFDASKEAVWIHKFVYGLGVVLIIQEPISDLKMQFEEFQHLIVVVEKLKSKGDFWKHNESAVDKGHQGMILLNIMKHGHHDGDDTWDPDSVPQILEELREEDEEVRDLLSKVLQKDYNLRYN
nr:retrotransposon protein, putative, Ty1-copia subclass [Tanacetum cinerariifolium]